MLSSSVATARRALLIAWVVTCGSGCERDPEPPPAPAPSAVEAFDPEMLVEGPVVVFGLRLPDGATVRGQHVTAAAVTIPHPMEKVASYLRAKLEPDTVETGPDKTVFLGARPKGSTPSDPTLKIVVSRTSVGTEVILNREPRKGPFPVHVPPNNSADQIGASEEPTTPQLPASIATLLPKPPPPPKRD